MSTYYSKGIIEKLDYLENLGIKVVWLNPVYESPMKDFGYDVSDYRKVAKEFKYINQLLVILNSLSFSLFN